MEISTKAEPIGHMGEFVVTNTILMSMITVTTLIIFVILLSTKKCDLKSKFYNFVEMLIEGLMSVIESVTGRCPLAKQVFAVISTFFIFVLFNNWLGLLPGVGSIGFNEVHEGEEIFVPLFRSANSDLNMTIAIAVISVTFTQVVAIKNVGVKSYLSKFFNFKSPIMFFVGILELVAETIKILSFSFRLFGNVFAGDVLLIVMFSLVPFIVPIPFMGIEMFAGFIQALIFSVLTLVFTNIASHAEH